MFSPELRHDDSLVLELQRWLHAHHATASLVAEMARRSGLSFRALERRFRRATGHSPLDYVQRIRVEAAKRRLEASSAPVDEIGWEAGYADAAAFRRLFKRVVGLTPSAYRRKFRLPQLG